MLAADACVVLSADGCVVLSAEAGAAAPGQVSVDPGGGWAGERQGAALAVTAGDPQHAASLFGGEVLDIRGDDSGIISLLRRSWLIAGVLFAALLAAAVALLRAAAARPAAGGTHHELLVGELAAGTGLWPGTRRTVRPRSCRGPL